MSFYTISSLERRPIVEERPAKRVKTESFSSPSNLNSLPNELLSHIFSFIGDRLSHTYISGVCQKFKRLDSKFFLEKFYCQPTQAFLIFARCLQVPRRLNLEFAVKTSPFSQAIVIHQLAHYKHLHSLCLINISSDADLSSFSQLNSLTRLKILHRHKINHSDLSFLTYLTRLKSLCLNWNQSVYPQLNFLSQLKKIKLIAFDFQDQFENTPLMYGCENLTGLEKLHVNTHDAKPIRYLDNTLNRFRALKTLSLPHLAICEIPLSSLYDFPSLTALNLCHHQLTSLEFLVKFPRLENLNLSYSHIPVVDNTLATLSRLTRLVYYQHPFNSNQRLEELLTPLTQLQTLKLSCIQRFSNFFMKGLNTFSSLSNLELSCSVIEEPQYIFLNRLAGLKKLNLNRTLCTSNAFVEYLVTHSNLTSLSLHLNSSKIQADTLERLRQLTSLNQLTLISHEEAPTSKTITDFLGED